MALLFERIYLKMRFDVLYEIFKLLNKHNFKEDFLEMLFHNQGFLTSNYFENEISNTF